MQPPSHKGPQASVHYQGLGWAKKGNNNNNNNQSPQPGQRQQNRPTAFSITPKNANINNNPQQYAQTYTANKGNPMLAANNSPFPTNNNNNNPNNNPNNNMNRARNFTTQQNNNFGNKISIKKVYIINLMLK